MNSRAVTSADVGWMVEIMCNCSPLVDNRERLCLGLGLSSSQLTDIHRVSDKKGGTHGYLTLALNIWISDSSEATFQKLDQVLRAQEFKSTADEILRKLTDVPTNSAAEGENSHADLPENFWKSRVVTPFDVAWIVRIMFENPVLVQSRERLCMGLGLSMSELTDILRDKASDTRVFLALALNTWISKFPDVTFEKLDKVLKAEKFIPTAERIREIIPQHPPSSHDTLTLDINSSVPTFWFDVPEDVHMFTGRVKDMKKMHESIVAQNGADEKNDMTVITAVCGMGGVGKTSLTIHYAWAFFKVFYVNVIWINSETKNTIADSFNRLARKLGQSTSSKLRDIVSSVYEYLGKTKTLIIFDNVECYNDVKSYIPNRTPDTLRPYVLLTSRNREWNLRTQIIDVNVFRTEESVEFFKTFLSLSTQEEMEWAEKISFKLQNLPLAIRQAGAYIKVQHRENREPIVHGLKSYLDLFESNSAELLKFEHWSHTADIYEKTIYTTWTVNMKNLKRQNIITYKIIMLISYFNSDNIPIKLLLSIPDTTFWRGRVLGVLGKNIEDCDVYSAIKLLSDFSLITKHFDSESISIHRLLQKVVRDQVQRKYKNRQLDCAISLITIPLRQNNYDYYDDTCLIHALSIREYIEKNRLQENRIKSFLGLITLKQGNSIDNNIMRLKVLLEEGRFEELLELYGNIRKSYITQAASSKNHVDEVFTLKFVNAVLYCVITECETHDNYDRVVRHCELITNIVLGFTVSYYDDLNEHSVMIMHDIEQIYTINIDHTLSLTKRMETRNVILWMVYHVLGIFYGNRKVRLDSQRHWTDSQRFRILNSFAISLGCLVELSAFNEIHRFLEDNEIGISDSIIYNQHDSELFFRYVVQKLYRKLEDSNLLSVESELVRKVCSIQSDIFTFYNNKRSFESAVECRPLLVECQLTLNKPLEALETLNSIEQYVAGRALPPGLNEVDLVLVDTLFKVINHPNGNPILNPTIEIALNLYELSWSRIGYSEHDQINREHGTRLFSSLVDSEVLLLMKWFQLWLEKPPCIHPNLDLTHIFKFMTNVFLRGGKGYSTGMRNIIFRQMRDIIFERSIPIVKLLYGFSKHGSYTSYCAEMTSHCVSYLASQEQYAEIIRLVKNYEIYLEDVIPISGIVDISNVIVADTIMKSGEECEMKEYEQEFCVLAHSIYNRVYKFNSPQDKILIKAHIGSGRVSLTNIMNCLATLSKCEELLSFVRACMRCLGAEEDRRSNTWVVLVDSIMEISEHPNLSSLREKLQYAVFSGKEVA